MAVYKSFPECQQLISKLKLGDSWHIDLSESLATISSHIDEYLLPKFEIFVDPSLQFSLGVFGWMLTEDHDLYGKYERSLANVTLFRDALLGKMQRWQHSIFKCLLCWIYEIK